MKLTSALIRCSHRIKAGLAENHFTRYLQGSGGAVLLWVIVFIVMAAGISVITMKVTTSSNFTQLQVDESNKAFYLAEAGGRYAFPIIKQYFYDPDTVVAMLNNQTFTLTGGDKYTLTLSHDGVDTFTLTSTGLRPNSKANALKSFTITEAPPGGGGDDDDDDDDDDSVSGLTVVTF